MNVPAPGAPAWSELDREWSEFWAGIEAHAHDPAAWFSHAGAGQLQRLLDRGRQWRIEHAHGHEHADAERSLYACHLRRLAPVLCDLQGALVESAQLLLQRREHIRGAREWARQIPGPQPAPRLRP
ncbi:MAG: hypothetical protein ACRD1Y_08555 [Terriglobales bacterium]